MTKGDIICMPSGKLAMYMGGSVHGAEFAYVDDQGRPLRSKHDHKVLDSFCISSTRLLAKLQPEMQDQRSISAISVVTPA